MEKNRQQDWNRESKPLYYPQLDSIRGLSFLGIFVYHSFRPAFGNSLISSFLEYLYHQLPLAIDVFFLLSSFLLTTIGVAEYEKRQNFSFINYFKRRVLRIWPLYYLLMLLSFFLVPILAAKAGVSVTLPDPVYYVFFISNFYYIDHVYFLKFLWTLSVEEQFYLLLGIALKFFVRYLKAIFVFLLAVSVLFSVYSYTLSDGGYFNTVTYFFDFASGGIAALLFSNKSKYILKFTCLSGWRRMAFYFYLPLHFIIFFLIDKLASNDLSSLLNRYLFIIYVSVLIVEQLVNKQRVTILEKNRFLIYTGKISYGLYCFHGISITAILLLLKKFQLDIPPYFSMVIIFCVNYIIAIISYTYFEKPFLRLKDRLRRI